MPPSSDRFSTSVMGSSAFYRIALAAIVIGLLWMAIHWAVLLP
ncbi:hypothetical protein [Rhizobium sp. BK251]|nr:hypothetical protein [Rhizobium sp. BK251]TCL75939.1 hypothetical protein EV286_101484 [Rhizobium sp. BK251]